MAQDQREHDKIQLLLVDDDPEVTLAYGQALAREGAIVETASSSKEGLARVQAKSFDVIVSDVLMPEMSGIDFLKAVRAHDLDVPVILMTGAPDPDMATEIVGYGAFRLLAKPVDAKELWESVLNGARLHQMARLKHEAMDLSDRQSVKNVRLGELAALDVRFTGGMKLLWMAFQPIISWRERRVLGYEAFLRTDEPTMRNPADILDAAGRLGRLPELGRAIRARVAASVTKAPANAKLFVNLHSADLNDAELYSTAAPLSKIATRVVLEVTERGSLSTVKDVTGCVSKLKALGYEIAIDDLGVGYGGLTSFTQLQPRFAKLDVSLVRGVDTDSQRQSIIKAMRKLCDELEILVIAEGVETAAERGMLVLLGCDILQGYLFGKPEKGFEPPHL